MKSISGDRRGLPRRATSRASRNRVKEARLVEQALRERQARKEPRKRIAKQISPKGNPISIQMNIANGRVCRRGDDAYTLISKVAEASEVIGMRRERSIYVASTVWKPSPMEWQLGGWWEGLNRGEAEGAVVGCSVYGREG